MLAAFRCGWIFVALCAVFSGDVRGQKPKPESPPLLDSLYNASFPKSYDCLLEEEHTDAFTFKNKSRARVYFLKPNREFALYFQKSPANPTKKIWMQDGGKNIWTLDSLGGRLRKIGAHKKREPMNGPGLNYWLWLPNLYTYPHYSLEEDVMENGQRRVTLATTNPNPYQMVRFYLNPKSYRVDSLKVYAYGNYLSKKMQLIYASLKKRGLPDSVIITDYANQATIRQAYSDCRKAARLPKSFTDGFIF